MFPMLHLQHNSICTYLRWLTATWFFSAASAIAAPYTLPSGSNLATGPTANSRFLLITQNNPAAAASAYGTEFAKPVRLGILGAVGFGQELGASDNVDVTLARLRPELKKNNLNAVDIENIKNEFESDLNKFGSDPYLLRTDLIAHTPMMPIVITSNVIGGAVTVDVKASGQSQAQFLNRPIHFNVLSGKAETASAIYTKTAMLGHFSVGFARPIAYFSKETGSPLEGDLLTGVKLNYYQLGLRRSIFRLTHDKNLNKLVLNELKRPLNQKTALSIDVGLLFTSRFYSVGASLEDVNVTNYNFKNIGLDCEESGSASAPGEDCYFTRSFAQDINLKEDFTLAPKATLEGSLYNQSRNLVLSMYGQVNPSQDLMGVTRQPIGLSLAYQSRNWLAPGFRVGAHNNQLLDGLSYLSLGLTFASSISIDLAYGLESVGVDNVSIPRKWALNVGLELLL